MNPSQKNYSINYSNLLSGREENNFSQSNSPLNTSNFPPNYQYSVNNPPNLQYPPNNPPNVQYPPNNPPNMQYSNYNNYSHPPQNYLISPQNFQYQSQCSMPPPNYLMNPNQFPQFCAPSNVSSDNDSNSVGENRLGSLNLNQPTPESTPDPFIDPPHESEPPKGSKKKGKGTGAKRTTPNHRWTEEDDVALISAWANTTNDPIKGVSQSGKKFWEEIARKYNASTKQTMSASILKAHWGDRYDKVKKFNGCFKRATQVTKSGFNQDSYMREALQMYYDENGHTFTHIKFWELVKETPKFFDLQANVVLKKTRLNEAGDYTTSSGGTSNIEGVNSVRPIGQKAAKRKEKAIATSEDKEQVLESEAKNREVMKRVANARSAMADARKFEAALEFIGRPTRDMTPDELERYLRTCEKLRQRFDL